MRSNPQIAKKAATDPVMTPTASTGQGVGIEMDPIELPEFLATGERDRRQAERRRRNERPPRT